jgi:phosphoglycolate phosphatase-like HAD superfamily hydrolase
MDDVLVLWDIDGTLLNADGVGRDLYGAVFLQLFGRSLSAYAPMAGRTDRAIILETLGLAGVDEPRRYVDPFIAGLGEHAPSVRSAVADRGHALPGAAAVLATLASARTLRSLAAAADAGAIDLGLGLGLGSGLGGGGGLGEGGRAGSFDNFGAPFLAAPPLTAQPVTAPPTAGPSMTASPLTPASMTAAPAVAAPLPSAPAVAAPLPSAPAVAAPLPSAPAVAAPLGAAPVVASPLAAPLPAQPAAAPEMAAPAMAAQPAAVPEMAADPTDGADGGEAGHIHQSVLTGNIRSVAEVKLAALGLREWLDLCIGAYGDDHEDRTELVHVARRRAAAVHGRSAAEFGGTATVVIGDTPLDIAAALAAGARAVGVATGSYSANDLAMAGADAVLSDLTDTAAVLRALLP